MTEKTDSKIDLIYGVEDRPPFREALFAALQHLLAIFVAIITPPLIVCGALQFDSATTGFLISMSLFVSGIATFIQCRRFGKLGAGLLCVQGTSFSFIAPLISAGLAGGLPLMLGCTIAASGIEIVISRAIGHVQKVINPLVAGVVVTLIGMSLIKVGIISCGGGFSAIEDGSFGNGINLAVAAVVIVATVIFNTMPNKYIRMSSIILGLIAGLIVSGFVGMFDNIQLGEFSWFQIPMPFKYGLDFSLSTFLSFALVYAITAIEAYGDITANSSITGQPIDGEVYVKRISGGVLADGFSSAIAGIFNSFPNSIFAQNNGIIQLTGVGSRYVGYFIAVLLVLMGIFPAVGVILTVIPTPVMGGATLLMFGSVAVAGIRIIIGQPITRKSILVMALGFGVGLGVEMEPAILDKMPKMVKEIFASGITAGGVTAILANILIRNKE